MFSLSVAKGWIKAIADIMEENRTYLTDLDSAIGDADHGINISRGFAAAQTSVEKESPADLAALFKLVSVALIKNTGGASGALYGTFFLRFSAVLKGESAVNAEFCNAVSSGVEAIIQLGHSAPGEKTMLDAFVPALEAARGLTGEDVDFKTLAASMYAAAKKGADSTVPMVATKGRASYLGERSAGHLDPGAVSASLIFKTLNELHN